MLSWNLSCQQPWLKWKVVITKRGFTFPTGLQPSLTHRVFIRFYWWGLRQRTTIQTIQALATRHQYVATTRYSCTTCWTGKSPRLSSDSTTKPYENDHFIILQTASTKRNHQPKLTTTTTAKTLHSHLHQQYQQWVHVLSSSPLDPIRSSPSVL
jgi:hypothetical protein